MPGLDQAPPRGSSGALSSLALRVHTAAHLEGTFTLRSGRTAHDYFDKYRFEADPEILREVVDGLVTLIPQQTDVIAGLELGGIPLVTLLSSVTGLPAAFVRKQAKPYGTRRLAEGADVGGRRVLLIEDVVTSGGQVATSAGELRTLRATVDCALCVIDRQEGGSEALAAQGVTLISLFSREEIDRAAAAPPPSA